MNQSHSPEEKRQDGYVIHKDGSMYPIEPYVVDDHEYPKMLYHADGRTAKVKDPGEEEALAHKGFLTHPEMLEEDPDKRHKDFHTEENVPAPVVSKSVPAPKAKKEKPEPVNA